MATLKIILFDIPIIHICILGSRMRPRGWGEGGGGGGSYLGGLSLNRKTCLECLYDFKLYV